MKYCLENKKIYKVKILSSYLSLVNLMTVLKLTSDILEAIKKLKKYNCKIFKI